MSIHYCQCFLPLSFYTECKRLIYCLLALSVHMPVSSHRCQRRQWHPTPVLLPGKSHGQRGWAGYHPWGHKGLDTTEHAPHTDKMWLLENFNKCFTCAVSIIFLLERAVLRVLCKNQEEMNLNLGLLKMSWLNHHAMQCMN